VRRITVHVKNEADSEPRHDLQSAIRPAERPSAGLAAGEREQTYCGLLAVSLHCLTGGRQPCHL